MRAPTGNFQMDKLQLQRDLGKWLLQTLHIEGLIRKTNTYLKTVFRGGNSNEQNWYRFWKNQ